MKERVSYWIVTGLLAALMFTAGLPDLLSVPQAVTIFTHLGYPLYLLPFLGAAKILGSLALVLPIPRRITEWAYAGIAFDLAGAAWSHLSSGDGFQALAPVAVGFALLLGSYLLRLQRDASRVSSPQPA